MTIRDVATHAGVAPATVSRALNEATRPLLSEPMLDRVLRAVEELDYKPDRIARSLRTGQSSAIGVAIPDIMNPLFPAIIRGIDDRLRVAGYHSLVSYTDDVDEGEHIKSLRDHQVDGLILATAQSHDPLVAAVADELPVVLVNRHITDQPVPAVYVDDGAGTSMAVKHLAELGHRRIGHVAGPQTLSTAAARRESFERAVAELGVDGDPELIVFAKSISESEGAVACNTLLDHHPDMTAIVAANDLVALGCYDALAGRGLRCPEDVSVVGFNDMPRADRFAPPLTTLRFDQYEMGEAAAELLLGQIAGSVRGKREIVLMPELIVRGSTAPPAVRSRS